MKLFGKQLFGKKDEDDEDDFDLDEELEHEAEAAEADELNEALVAQSARDADGEDGLDDMAGQDNVTSDGAFDDLPPESAPFSASETPESDGRDGETADADEPEEEIPAFDLDEIDFGDDDDEDNGDGDGNEQPDDASDAEDDFDEDFDDDEDEEQDEGGGLFGKPAVRYGAIAVALILLLGGVGGGAWVFLFSGADGEDQIAAEENLRGIALPPPDTEQSSGGGLNSLASGGGLEPPAAGEPPSDSATEQVAAQTEASTSFANTSSAAGGLNALSGGLNTLSTGAAGAGTVAPVTTAASFSRYPDLPTGQPLAAAPEPDLIEIRGDGVPPLPKKGQDGRTPFGVYARPSELAEGQAYVALVATDLGLNRAGTIAAIRKLPPEVTLSFSPYAEELDQWMVRARRAGHEVMVGLPMESDRFPIEDPGPLALMTVLAPEQNLTRLFDILSLFQGFIGVEVIMGDRYTLDRDRVSQIVQVLADRGLMVLEGAWNQRSAVPDVAAALGAPLAVSNLRLDTVMARSAIETKLKQLEDTAKTRRIAVGTTRINPAIVDRLSAWFVALQINSIQLVPLSAVANRQDLS